MLQKKKNVSNEFHGMMDRSAEYVLDYTQIKKKVNAIVYTIELK